MEYTELYQMATGRSCPRHIAYEWPLWFKDFNGFALGPIVFVKDRNDLAVLCHELVHVQQFYNNPMTFWIRYGIELIRTGYKNNKYEIDAYYIQAKAKKILGERKD